MKEYQNLIGKIIVAAAIITGSVIIGNATLKQVAILVVKLHLH